MSATAVAATAGKVTAGKMAGQLGMQMGASAVNKTADTLVDRLFAKRDRKINWKESQRYGERNQQWAKDMAQYNENIAVRLAEHDQNLAKDFFDYTLEQDSPAQQIKRLKEAGLNPALMYETGGAAGHGMTGGASAGNVRANAPEENYKPMGLVSGQAMAMRETPAERELKLAQAEDLRSQKAEREGVGKELKETQIAAITAGIESDAARTALTKAQTLAVELNTRIAEATEEDTIDIVNWTAKQAMRQYEIATDEAYISKETREEKIGILRQTLINSVIEANLKRAVIKHTGKQDEKIDAEIRRIATDITDTYHSWTQWEKGHRLEQLKHKLNESKHELEKTISEYQGINKVGGKVLDKAVESIWRSANIIDQLLGYNPETWK